MGRLDALRLAMLTQTMKRASARRSTLEVAGLRLTVEPGVCHPSPAMGASFSPLFGAALEGMRAGERVLDLGTGCGVWALMASRAGAEVTATDLAHVPIEVVARAARANRVPTPRLLSGDLFEPVTGERFDRVLFNPPFHLGEPRTDEERAYFGGADGAVLRRFLRELPDHLTSDGHGYVVLPATERASYEDALVPRRPRTVASRWMPVMGTVELLALAP
ncbi:MAG: methyltransferase [Sandaracinaceae bacterium]